MRAFYKDLKTPAQYIDRTWLRRSMIIAGSIPLLVAYLCGASGAWWRDCQEVWRGSGGPGGKV
jgi:hypothetical protein